MTINEIIDNNYPNKMKYYGPSIGGISWNGIKTDILKSAIQKYIRRGNLNKALWCINELDLFNEMLNEDNDHDRLIKSFTTNIMNRLFIISCEDVGIGNINLPVIFDTMRNKWEMIRNDPTKTIERMTILQDMVNILVNCKKSREISHIRAVYWNVPNSKYYEKYKKKYPSIYNIDYSKYPENNYILNFIELFDEKSDKCFYWFFYALYKDNKPTSKNIKPLIDYIIKKEVNMKYIRIFKILNNWYRKYKYREFWIYAAQIILIALRRIKFVKLKIDRINHIELYKNNLLNGPIEIDNYCIDIHTRDGRDKNKKHFVNEGSYVENELSNTNQDYKKIYKTFNSI